MVRTVVTAIDVGDKGSAMRSINQVLDAISGKRVLVIGDAMLDHYLHGDVQRMSPEAPVPVLTHQSEDFRLGGAANVALNLEGLGIRTVLISTIGEDRHGACLQDLVREQLSDSRLFSLHDRITTTKTRVVDKNQQLLRIDQEIVHPVPDAVATELLDAVKRVLTERDTPSIIVLSDYNKGLLTHDLTRQLISIAAEHNIKVLVDPKGRNFSKYRGATLLTPNVSELETASGNPCTDQNNLNLTAKTLREQLELDALIVTMGPHGLLMVEPGDLKRYPALTQEVFDVSGAGDTVLAAITGGMLAHLPMEETLEFANLCAAKVIQKRGTTPISLQLLVPASDVMKDTLHFEELPVIRKAWTQQGKRIVFTNGCFDLLHEAMSSFLGSPSLRETS